MTEVAFLGTGTMGEPMARNLLRADFRVRVWNRTRTKAELLAADGAIVADTPEDAADRADVLVTMLLDGASTAAAARGAVQRLRPGGVWVQMGTLGIEGMHDALAEAGPMPVVDAPVLGTRGPAESGELVVLAAGPDGLRPAVDPLFDAMGSRTVWLGQDAEAATGTRLKLAVNNWVLALTNAVGESMALADALGVDPGAFLDALSGTGVDSAYAHIKGSAILNDDYTPSFAVDAALKDAELIRQAGGDALRLDLAEAARQRLARTQEAGYGDRDMAAAYFASFLGRDDP